MKKLSLLLLLFVASYTIKAQTADEIVNSYLETIGGKEKLEKLEGIKMQAEVNQGMIIPVEIIRLKDGRQMTSITLQGKTIKQGVFDGNTLWGTNFMTQKAEKSTDEQTKNFKLSAKDFPDPFFNYKDKGYTISLEGKETIDGAETFKIKLTQKPLTIDGKKVDNISYYFFDTENFVPIAMQTEIKTGPSKGMVSEMKFSDYQEVDGIYFPFSLTQGVKGQPGGQPITIKKIELNPTTSDADFAFPEQIEKPKATDNNSDSKKAEETKKDNE